VEGRVVAGVVLQVLWGGHWNPLRLELLAGLSISSVFLGLWLR
jgi:hypothetical protein